MLVREPLIARRTFPVLLGYNQRRRWDRAAIAYPVNVPWDFVAEHREQCLRNHDQTPERLAERGGLGPAEMLCVISDRHWREYILPNCCDADECALPELLARLCEWKRKGAEVSP